MSARVQYWNEQIWRSIRQTSLRMVSVLTVSRRKRTLNVSSVIRIDIRQFASNPQKRWKEGWIHVAHVIRLNRSSPNIYKSRNVIQSLKTRVNERCQEGNHLGTRGISRESVWSLMYTRRIFSPFLMSNAVRSNPICQNRVRLHQNLKTNLWPSPQSHCVPLSLRRVIIWWFLLNQHVCSIILESKRSEFRWLNSNSTSTLEWVHP